MNEKIVALLVTLFLGLFIVIGAGVTFFVKKKEKFIDAFIYRFASRGK